MVVVPPGLVAFLSLWVVSQGYVADDLCPVWPEIALYLVV